MFDWPLNVPWTLRSASIHEEDVSENPFVDGNFVSRNRNHAGSLGLGLRALDSSPCPQTRRHSQTFPFSPEISLDSPSLLDCLGSRASPCSGMGRFHMVAALLPVCSSFSWGVCLSYCHLSSLLAAEVPIPEKTRLFTLPWGQTDWLNKERSCLRTAWATSVVWVKLSQLSGNTTVLAELLASCYLISQTLRFIKSLLGAFPWEFIFHFT